MLLSNLKSVKANVQITASLKSSDAAFERALDGSCDSGHQA